MEEEGIGTSCFDLTHLKCALLAMEPPDCIISLARKSGGGSLSEEVQNFILRHCVVKSAMGKCNELDSSYVQNVLKKVIVAAESCNEEVVEGIYENYAYCMSSVKDHDSLKANKRIIKEISFLLDSDKCDLRSMNFVVPLQCSLNMLEGDTGCAIWPSSLFLSEFILSNQSIFSNKFCLEVGSGVGLVGIVLLKAKVAKVILSDGDLSSLSNLKLNLKLNQLNTENKESEDTKKRCTNPSPVECKYLPWESASEYELTTLQPDIILGADIIYNPSCMPHLVRVLSILLTSRALHTHEVLDNGNSKNICPSSFEPQFRSESKGLPVAYITTVIRNVETFNYFLKLAGEAHLSVEDITESSKPLLFLPYMLSYDRTSVHLYRVYYSGH